MTEAKSGDTVQVQYTGKLEDGTIFDTSEGRSPLEFTLGAGQIIPGFEAGVVGMQAGEEKTITVEPQEGYGEHREELTAQIPREQFPEDMNPEVGQQLQVTTQSGQPVPVMVTEVTNDNVTVDANHPLAGKKLFFDVKLVAVAS